jgi:hypothetical protein
MKDWAKGLYYGPRFVQLRAIICPPSPLPDAKAPGTLFYVYTNVIICHHARRFCKQSQQGYIPGHGKLLILCIMLGLHGLYEE